MTTEVTSESLSGSDSESRADEEALGSEVDAEEVLEALQSNIAEAFRGKPRVVRLTVTCLLARGHLLLEDVPGVGKTTLGLALARSLGLSFRRIQFTSDLMPSDITGVSVYSQKRETFEFQAGPIFSNVVLADEINRTTPRTQSALLEAMSEGSVTVDNETRSLPDPFFVVATQNPLEHHGTYPLPESQLDRFLMRLSIGYPDREIERELLLERELEEPVKQLGQVTQTEALKALQRRAASVDVEESVVDYVLDLVAGTREHEQVRIGVSTRGALGLVRAAKAHAVVNGREFVIPDDVRQLVVPVLAHRLSMRDGESSQDRQSARLVLEEIASGVDVPV
jgi:MoxR-like ATPase